MSNNPFSLHLNQNFPILYVMHAQMIRNWWLQHRKKLLRLALVLMIALAAVRLGYEFWRLIFDACPPGAIDLNTLYNLTYEWFAGIPFPSKFPPASYPMLWLFYGWLPIGAARWLWALFSIVLLVGLAFILVRAIESKLRSERIFFVTFLLAIYPTAITIGNGQLTLHVIYPLFVGILLVREKGGQWGTDLLASLLLLFALIKPSITVPFLWIVLFTSSSIRVLVMVSTGYVALTLFSISFQEKGFMGFLQDMKFHGSGVFTHEGYASLSAWLGALDLEAWAFPAAFVVLVALGIWCYCYRHSDLWLKLGVTALVARLWIYHRLYDDLLIILPIIALFRIAKQEPSSDNRDVKAGVLLFLSWAAMLIPGTLYLMPSPLGDPFRIGQAIIWILMLIFLLLHAKKSRNSVLKPWN
jgi:hypothetical protein